MADSQAKDAGNMTANFIVCEYKTAFAPHDISSCLGGADAELETVCEHPLLELAQYVSIRN